MRLRSDHKALIRRYLTWAYKSTKESFDRLERKTTQLLADEHILASLNKKNRGKGGEYAALVEGYKEYIAKKKQTPISQGQYDYLKDRLSAIEDAVTHFLGAKELGRMRTAYEEEFTRRIWESKDH
jgi:hypothetical protein